MGYRMIDGKAYPVAEIGGLKPNSISKEKNKGNASFKDVLSRSIQEQNNTFTVSKHAAERLEKINFSQNDMDNIEKGFEMAENKGAKNSLMIYKDVALITSIENKTLITAIEKDRAQDNIFTNIDSVVIL